MREEEASFGFLGVHRPTYRVAALPSNQVYFQVLENSSKLLGIKQCLSYVNPQSVGYEWTLTSHLTDADLYGSLCANLCDQFVWRRRDHCPEKFSQHSLGS